MRDRQSLPMVLLAFANDRADPRRKLRNLPEETRRLRDCLERAEDAGLCELVIRTNALLGEILDVFQDLDCRGRIGIFHYAGHANSYQLLFETAEGKPAPADAASFARFLANQTGLKLVFLNACSTQAQVQGLLNAGVSVVIATSQDIQDKVATEFAERFYKGLAGGAKVRTAFKEAGAAVQLTHGRTRNLYPAWARDAGLADRVPWVIYPPDDAQGAKDWSLDELRKILQLADAAGSKDLEGLTREGAQTMFSVHLPNETIRKLSDTLSRLGLATRQTRSLLLAHIHRGFAAGLPEHDNALSQIESDLVEMNTVARLEDGQVPMEQWLENAVGLLRARSFTEQRLFQQALDEVRSSHQ